MDTYVGAAMVPGTGVPDTCCPSGGAGASPIDGENSWRDAPCGDGGTKAPGVVGAADMVGGATEVTGGADMGTLSPALAAAACARAAASAAALAAARLAIAPGQVHPGGHMRMGCCCSCGCGPVV